MSVKKKILNSFFATLIPLACALTALNATALSASAATQTQDGIEATLTVASEDSSGNIDANLAIVNTNNFDLENVSFDFVSPSGYVISDSSSIPNAIEIMKAGEQQTFSVEYVKAEKIPPATTENNNKKSEVVPVNSIQPKNVVPPDNSTADTHDDETLRKSSPDTGDTFPLASLISIAIVSGAGMMLCIKKKKLRMIMSLKSH